LEEDEEKFERFRLEPTLVGDKAPSSSALEAITCTEKKRGEKVTTITTTTTTTTTTTMHHKGCKWKAQEKRGQ